MSAILAKLLSLRQRPLYARMAVHPGRVVRKQFGKALIALANNGKWLFRAMLLTYGGAAVLHNHFEPGGIRQSIHWVLVTAYTQGTKTSETASGLIIEDILIPVSWLYGLLAGAYIVTRAVQLANELTLTHVEEETIRASLLRIEKKVGTLPPDATELPVPEHCLKETIDVWRT